jgi:hypothetical protein
MLDKISNDYTYFGARIKNFEEITCSNPEITIKISEEIMNTGSRPGFISGLLYGTILGNIIPLEDFIVELNIDDEVKRRRALVALCNFCYWSGEIDETNLLTILKILDNSNIEDLDIQMALYSYLLRINPELVNPWVINKLKKTGIYGTRLFNYETQHSYDIQLNILKMSYEMIEREDNNDELLNELLAKIYPQDPTYVVEIMRNRIINGQTRIANNSLEYQIQQSNFPIIKMIEECINEKRSGMDISAHLYLQYFFKSSEEWFEWCRKWKDDDKKKRIVHNSIAEILSEFLKPLSPDIKREAIEMSKEFAFKEGISYENETRDIHHPGSIEKEEKLKALKVMRKIIHPPIPIDISILEENLNQYVNITKTFGKEWLLRNARTYNPHIIVRIYQHKVDRDRLDELNELVQSDISKEQRYEFEREYGHIKGTQQMQQYWDDQFGILIEKGIKLSKSKRHDISNSESFLTEVEVLARLTKTFNVIPEPEIESLLPSRIDALIELNGQETLIEIAEVHERDEIRYAMGGVSVPGGKVKNVLLNKFQRQFRKGTVDIDTPVAIILSLKPFIDSIDVENAVYGSLGYSSIVDNQTGKVVDEGAIRFKDSFFHQENSGIISAIGVYRSNYTLEDSLVGKLFYPPPFVSIHHPISREFHIELRNTLFGNSETSNWKSLMEIDDISEDRARYLYENGIEDLRVLSMLSMEELSIEGIDKETLKQYQKKALKIIFNT